MTTWGRDLALPVSPERDHLRGPADAPVTLLEYGDYQCPFCGAAVPAIEAVREEMGSELRFAFRHFPLVGVHPYASIAAEAAEASGAQGSFWDMHDLLFADQQHLAPPDLVARAAALGLDVGAFQVDLVEHRHAPRVQEDFLSGVHSGVAGTPTFFINGIRYTGPPDPDHLLAATEVVASRR
ncbi:MAG TPA: DsbA family protein [Acidimicrobiales bacterium]|jgi:protein-disulfide isomerase|nr:DsbA family protein [Acidimicrobiales bacterium]